MTHPTLERKINQKRALARDTIEEFADSIEDMKTVVKYPTGYFLCFFDSKGKAHPTYDMTHCIQCPDDNPEKYISEELAEWAQDVMLEMNEQEQLGLLAVMNKLSEAIKKLHDM